MEKILMIGKSLSQDPNSPGSQASPHLCELFLIAFVMCKTENQEKFGGQIFL